MVREVRFLHHFALQVLAEDIPGTNEDLLLDVLNGHLHCPVRILHIAADAFICPVGALFIEQLFEWPSFHYDVSDVVIKMRFPGDTIRAIEVIGCPHILSVASIVIPLTAAITLSVTEGLTLAYAIFLFSFGFNL
jgi:hypothetical protein